MRVGVIGVGYWGKKIVDEYIKMGEDIIVSDINKENLKFCEEKYDIKTMTDYKDILSDDRITAVNVCTPNATHFRIAKDCLLAGKNVLVEKPLTLKVEEAEDLANIAVGNNLVLTVGHIFRFNNAIQHVKKMMDYGEFGEIYIVKLKWTNIEPLYEDRDVIFDLAPHPFDITNFLFGRDSDEIFCTGNAYRRKEGVEAAFINTHLNKILINIEISWLTPRKERALSIVGAKKSVFVDCLYQKVEVYEDEGWKNLNIVPTNTIRSELESFLACIKNRNVSIAEARVGVDNVRMLEIAEKSLYEKQSIKVYDGR